jgi:hypothetical protein
LLMSSPMPTLSNQSSLNPLVNSTNNDQKLSKRVSIAVFIYQFYNICIKISNLLLEVRLPRWEDLFNPSTLTMQLLVNTLYYSFP